MKKSSVSNSTRSPKRSLGVSQLPQTKRRALSSIDNIQVEKRAAPLTLGEAFKHKMELRSRSGSGKKGKKKPSPKKDSPTAAIKRPDYPEDAPSSERMVLRPKKKSPAKKSAPVPARGNDPEKKTEERGFQYVHLVKERTIPPKGFTHMELQMCRSYMLKQNFEMDGPIPKQMKFFKSFLDQVRASPYGVTIGYPGGIIGSSFQPYKKELEKDDPTVRGYVEDMTKKLFGAIKRKRNQVYTSLGADNLVRVAWSFFLLTLRVQLRGSTDTPRIVEALFYQAPGTSVVNPKLVEWKIKQGSKMEFSTVDIL